MNRSKRAKTASTNDYREILNTMEQGLNRLQADHAYFSVLTSSTDTRERKNAINGKRATSTQIARQKSALKIFRNDIRRAFDRGDIYKI